MALWQYIINTVFAPQIVSHNWTLINIKPNIALFFLELKLNLSEIQASDTAKIMFQSISGRHNKLYLYINLIYYGLVSF